jgi:signal transduction histidine kinase
VAAAREAMVNASKHSGAARVDVYAEAGGEQVEIDVRDRGRGFDPATVSEDRRGIRGSIVDRMARHGGRTEIASKPGGGTEVRLWASAARTRADDARQRGESQ